MNHNLKKPPYSEVAESSVLGSILMLKSNYDLVKDIISADDFYELKNQKIFLAIVETVERDHNTPNEINIAEKLAACNSEALISWSVYLSNIEQYYTSSKEVLEFAKIIKENSARRKAINECLDFLNLAYNPNYPIENLRDNISRMDSVIAPQAKELKEFARLSSEMMDFYQRKENNKDFVSTGYRELNRMRFYFSKGHLTIVAARPRMGKSAFAVNCIVNYFTQEVNPLPVLFFSLEMPETENASRIHSIMSSVSGDKLLYNHDGITREEWGYLLAANNRAANFKLNIIDDVYSINEITSIIRATKRDRGLAAVFVDYLQLVNPTVADKKLPREQQISSMTRTFKLLAKSLKIPIILLSQLNRNVDYQGKIRMPQLADLRESGAIEQDADKILFIHRHIEYSSNKENPIDDLNTWKRENKCEQNATLEWFKSLATFIIAKNRQGSSGKVDLLWHGDTLTFTDEDNYNA